MKKIINSVISIIASGLVLVTPFVAQAPAFADVDDNGCYHGAIISTCDDGQGSSISDTLKMVVRILMVGVGVFAVIGITITGIQYLTAGSNEEQTRKAKRRLIEIVIGIVAFVLLYVILAWLLPGFRPDQIWS